MVSFNRIPDNVRTPLFFAEVDNSQASFFQINQRALLIGPKLPAGTATANEAVLITSLAEARALFGIGSALAHMVERYRANDGFGELWCMPVDDDGGAVAATGTITVTGAATEAGVLNLYIAGRRKRVIVGNGDGAGVIGDAIAAAITADDDLPVTAVDDDAGVVTLTAKHGGLIGDDIDLRINFLGTIGGETTPTGVTIAFVAMAGGAANASIATALTALGDKEFDFVGCAYNDTATLNLIKNAWDDVTGRWSWDRQIYGHVFAGIAGAAAELVAFGDTRNDPHVTLIGANSSPTPPYEWAGAWTGQASVAVREDPARPWQTLPLVGVKAPKLADQFTLSTQNTLLNGGIATYTVADDGTVAIQRSVTTYRENAFGQPDPSFLDAQTLYTLMAIIRRLRQAITQKYPRHKLVNNGTRIGPGQAAVSPKIIRAELIAQYSQMEAEGLVENMAAFKANLIVERDANDVNRINVLYPPDLANQLRVFAVLAQFRLQYQAAA